jgi:hypothetical protein
MLEYALLYVLAVIAIMVIVVRSRVSEPYLNMGGNMGINLAQLSTQALDSAPTTSEVKNHYKNLLVFANDDIQKQGVKGLRILADFRDRVYGKRNFRDDLKVEDFMANWPAWLPPLDPTIKEPVPDSSAAVMAESSMLAYLQKNFPQENMVDEQTGSTIRNLVEDFGYRFVFKKGYETVELAPDFLRQPLLKDWKNPAA